MSKHGNGNRKISLFLGIVHSKRSASAGAGATASNIELRGIPFVSAWMCGSGLTLLLFSIAIYSLFMSMGSGAKYLTSTS